MTPLILVAALTLTARTDRAADHRLVIIQADDHWATYYDLAGHRSDGERMTTARALRVPLAGDGEPAWIERTFDCRPRLARASENEDWAPIDPNNVFMVAFHGSACMGELSYAWAETHRSVESAKAAAAAEGARLIEAERELPPFVQPQGPLHFVASSHDGDGYFFAPLTLTRAEDSSSAEATALKVNIEPIHVAEGQVQWQWERLRFDCMESMIHVLRLDAFSADGQRIDGFGPDTLPPSEADTPREVQMMAYACIDFHSEDFREAPTLEAAVQSVLGQPRD